jgi:asparagine synthase (glutamine-hydrolysing)
MCGILAIFGSSESQQQLRTRALAISCRLRHRGPDWNGVFQHGKNILAHERLAIVDVDGGAQPLLNETGKIALTVNGEIYNHLALRETLTNHKFKTNSDCEPILYLYEDFGDDFVHKLRGDFGFVVYDTTSGHYLAARDPIGVVPLYIGWGKDGSVWFASECKALKDDCERFEAFPPGKYYSSRTGTFEQYYKPGWWDEAIPKGPSPVTPEALAELRKSLEDAVVRRMMCDVPFGVLFSGGLDSSLVASIVSRHTEAKSRDWWPRLHSFCVGLEGAPDLIAAKQVADFLGTVHHEFHFTVQEGIDALRDVIYHLETYDVTTIRASTPMYFLARRIKAMGVKMVLSGEGSDEIFGGYLYFHLAPDADEFHRECCKRVKNLYKFDCLRANKSTAAWGVEVRVPFLDQEFIDTAMAVNPKEKVCSKERIEKWVIRKAFDTPEKPYLPDSILWRQKEQFSDGVGYSWIGGLKAHAEKEITDELFAKAAEVFPFDTPDTKEAYYYRRIFETIFSDDSTRKTVSHWVPTWGASKDPSGRAQVIHVEAKADI